MGKKRGKSKNAREDDDIDLTGPSCRHIKKGTDQTLLKKLSGNTDWTSCSGCNHGEDKENSVDTGDAGEENDTEPIWMCLKCGHRGCGRNAENQHAIKHYETPRSDPHCLVVSMDNWSVWCYICDDEVQYSKTGHLAQLLTSLKKQTSADPVKRPQKIGVKEDESLLEAKHKTEAVNADESEDKENIDIMDNRKKSTKKDSVGKSQSSKTEDNGGIPVKGLSNLGNTCFFNAVIQNLSQTHLLRKTLNKATEDNMSLDIKPAATSKLEPVIMQLDRPGSLTLAMCQLLNEIQESKKGVVTPQELLTQVCKKAARFKGMQQQDSQELLRYLLDGMRAEEIKRVSSGVMEALKQSRNCTDEDKLKSLVKEYEKNGFPKNFVDQVFGGEMSSTIMCQQCKTVSVVKEMFLDLSLPVFDEAYRKKNLKKGFQKTSVSSQDVKPSPALSNGNEDMPTGAGSKYQQKKAKKQAKKQSKQQNRQQKIGGRVTLDSLTSPSHAENERMDPSEDENEGKNYDSETHKETPQREANPAQAIAAEQDAQNGDRVPDENGIEEGEDSETDGDSSAPSTVTNRFTALSKQDSVLDDDKSSDVEKEGEDDIQLVSEMEKVNLDDAFIEEDIAMEHSETIENEPQECKEYTVVDQDPELAFRTLATRAAPEKQECSVESCLFQFTEVETLTQNNSLLCVTCTKRQGNKDKAEGSKKNVYTDALKQMLISTPPPVLTLHLKRFQQNGYSICKVNRHVQFPLILDVAPFCAVQCKAMMEGDFRILYSLYGIVVHSGTMRSGHYTAYVKVRPNPASNGVSLEDSPSGTWFHISDTHVQPVSQSQVQSCQAYLLFYERIL